MKFKGLQRKWQYTCKIYNYLVLSNFCTSSSQCYFIYSFCMHSVANMGIGSEFNGDRETDKRNVHYSPPTYKR